jgi:hypothetical protein
MIGFELLKSMQTGRLRHPNGRKTLALVIVGTVSGPDGKP